MSLYKIATSMLLVASLAVGQVGAESHTVSFVNNCGTGTPLLKANQVTLSSGTADYVSNGPLSAAIAYLDTGCGENGQGCVTVETTLINPTSPGAGSSTDISLISPLAFNVAISFAYKDGCTNGASCTSADCPDAFHSTTDYSALRQCEADNAGLVVTFC
ncbi:hypothetical protein PLICRDRAFT_172178 [Plicaturopsis crispa FD-325 SS-3]|nr:hypothetical protein PLICRDRAFT_172178 [Plicaturopsis crispa FD-325 SS-3]